MLYLAYTEGAEPPSDADGPWFEVRPVASGLAFVHSEQHRSAVYHALKDLLPRDTPLLVAELSGIPKFKGLAPGALAWARARIGT